MASVVFFAGRTDFSRAVISKIGKLGLNIKAIVLSGYPPRDAKSAFPVRSGESEKQVNYSDIGCRKIWIPARSWKNVEAKLSHFADYFVSVCFPYLIPSQIYKLAKIASMNVHPSLLPAYRGPQPLFWQFKNAEQNLGVSIHLLSEELDAGPIVSQQRIRFETFEQFNRQLTQTAVSLLERICTGNSMLASTPQNQKQASFNSSPETKDFQLSKDWSAQRMYRFIRATENLKMLYPLQLGDKKFMVRTVIDYQPMQSNQAPYEISDKTLTLRCSDGIIQLKIEHES